MPKPKKHYRTPTLEETHGSIMGYLNASKERHGGMDAATLITRWNWGNKPHLSVSSLALLAEVNWQTMDKWIDKLHAEAGIERVRPKRTTED